MLPAIPQLAPQTQAILSNVAKSATGITKKYSYLITPIFIVLFLVAIGFLYYTNYAIPRVILLTGPERTSSGEFATALVQSNNRQAIQTFALESLNTEGYEDNRQRIAEDSTGRVIGFGHDGFGDSTNVRILVPLDHSYLHILCNRNFFRALETACACGTTAASTSPKSLTTAEREKQDQGRIDVTLPTSPCSATMAPTLYDVVYFIKNFGVASSSTSPSGKMENRRPRIALGPSKSGVKEVASSVIEHFRLSEDSYDEVTIETWATLRDRLRDNAIDIAFYLGSSNSTVVREIANDDTCFLLDLGQDSLAISKDLHNKVKAEDFVQFQYGRRIQSKPEQEERRPRGHMIVEKYSSTSPQWVTLREPEFCENIKVLATRRIMMCPKDMSESLAYEIALHARQVLSQDVPPSSLIHFATEKESDFRFLLHPAARLISENQVPSSSILRQLFSAFPAIFVAIAFFVFQIFKKSTTEASIGPPDTEDSIVQPASVNESAKAEYLRLVGLIEHLHREMDLFPVRVLTVQRYRELESKIAFIEKCVEGSFASGTLTIPEYESLKEGISKELRAVFASDFSKTRRKARRTQ